jgi:C1A family cysteine protease
MEGTIHEDSGAAIRDGIKSVNRQGACDEQLWPYDISQFTVQPPSSCYDVAAQHKTISYARVAQNVQLMKSCLASGYPFVYGFVVYESFESAQVAATGYVPMPLANEAILGGHAVLCVGYDDAKKVFICKNSWSDQWGDKGSFYIPYQYLINQNLASDFWTIRKIM